METIRVKCVEERAGRMIMSVCRAICVHYKTDGRASLFTLRDRARFMRFHFLSLRVSILIICNQFTNITYIEIVVLRRWDVNALTISNEMWKTFVGKQIVRGLYLRINCGLIRTIGPN